MAEVTNQEYLIRVNFNDAIDFVVLNEKELNFECFFNKSKFIKVE